MTLQPWQEKILIDIESYSKNPKELLIMTSGRQTGKSIVAQLASQRLWNDLLANPHRIAKIDLGEGTVYGSRYHTVRITGGNWNEMEKWCKESFGEGSRALWGEMKAPEPARRWYINNSKFWFRDIKDRDWFLLKWQPTVGASE